MVMDSAADLVVEGLGVQRAAVAVVDDHPLFRQGLTDLLGREVDLEVVGGAGTAVEALELAQRCRLDLAIVDVLLPCTSGVSLTAALKRLQPDCKVMALSMIDEPTRIAEMMRAGANGFALKSQPPSEIVQALRAVLAGQTYLPPSTSSEQIQSLIASDDAWPLRRLTQRELEIFELLVVGRSNEDIAARLLIAKRTVETHRQHIMKKVGARSLVELVRLGMKHGLATNES